MSELFSNQKTENQITTYMERSLHASLKMHFCHDESKHEIKIGRFVADVCDGNTIFEIQTGSFSPLRKKLQFYLENTDFNIVVVRPIAQNRKILWLDEESGELKKAPRISSRHENLASGIANLIYLKDFIFDYSDIVLVPYETASGCGVLKCIKVDRFIIDDKVVNGLIGFMDKEIKIDGVDIILNSSYIGG